MNFFKILGLYGLENLFSFLRFFSFFVGNNTFELF